MAAQLEDGFTRIANEILDHLMKTRLNGTQNSIIQCVIRNTYGFQRKSHDMALSFISTATGIHKDLIKRELDKLIEFKVILVFKEATFRSSREIGMNKNVSDWLVYSKPNSRESTKQSTLDELVPEQSTKQSTLRVDQSVYQERKSFKEIKDNIYSLFEKWNSLNIVNHRKMTPQIELQLKMKLGTYSPDELIHAMEEYEHILKSDDYVLTTKWGLEDFLSKSHYEKFLPDREPRVNYLKNQNSFGSSKIAQTGQAAQNDIAAKRQRHTDIEIARNRWISEGNEPDDFRYAY